MDKDKKIVIWGLGINGGGLASALFFLKKGFSVSILDDKGEEDLKVTLDQLKDFRGKYFFSKTDERILLEADVIVKNPAIRKHPFLKESLSFKTDISLFLEENENPLICITGTKGKSSLSSLLNSIFLSYYPHSYLGGNISYSPLNFLGKVEKEGPIILELSSWQLGDLPLNVLSPHISIITNLYADHQNTYDSFNDYVKDKMRIFENQTSQDFFFCEEEAYYHFIKPLLTRDFKAKLILFPSFSSTSSFSKEENSLIFKEDKVFYREREKEVLLFSIESVEDLPLALYQKKIAGALAYFYGMPSSFIEKAIHSPFFLEHRLEKVREWEGIDFYNDSAATMPEATVASVKSLIEEYGTLVLITGGTDKDLCFKVFSSLFKENIYWVLLEGSATKKIQDILEDKGIHYIIFSSLEECLDEALSLAEAGEAILFSPSSASFEKFKNEFDRGNQFKELVSRL